MNAVDLPDLVRPKGVWRDQKLPCSLILSFPDVPTDDDMRAWHEAADTLSAMVDERKDWARRFKLNGLTPWDWMTRAERAEANNAKLRRVVAAADAMRLGNDCPMCDSGKLRNPIQEHWDTCAFAAYDAARAAIEGEK
jgi:hypothetical protein